MPIGAFTGQFDLPLLLVILFVGFFLCLVYYLHQEDKREGYPLVSKRTARTGNRVQVQGFPAIPKPKLFLQPHGRDPVYAPRRENLPPIAATGVGNPTGDPIDPVGDPLLSGTGAASWVEKIDEPDLSHDGQPVFAPLRVATGFKVMKGDPDPRGFVVLGMDKAVAGRVADIWVDTSEHYARFLEVELDGAADAVEAGRHVLMPIEFCSVNGRKRTVTSGAITAAQFARVPGHRSDVILTARDEQRIRGYFGGGLLWGTDLRRGPLL